MNQNSSEPDFSIFHALLNHAHVFQSLTMHEAPVMLAHTPTSADWGHKLTAQAQNEHRSAQHAAQRHNSIQNYMVI